MTETSNREQAAKEFKDRVITPTHGDAPDLPEAYRGKPDQSEPWRYVCPDCGGQVYSDRSSAKYECKVCDSYWLFKDLHDKKKSGEVSES